LTIVPRHAAPLPQHRRQSFDAFGFDAARRDPIEGAR
jgi:hypothetical protein